jgi:hypothetical protein
MRKILIYSDKKYEYQVKYFMESLNLTGNSHIPVIFYTIGFESDFCYPNLIKKFFPINNDYGKDFYFYKPAIMIDAIDYFGGDFLFLDTDIVFGKRFNIDFFDHDYNFPMLTTINWPYPIRFGDHYTKQKIHNPNLTYIGGDGVERPAVEIDWDGSLSGNSGAVIFNEVVLMKHYGIKKRTMRYVGTCLLSFGEKCREIILEWKSIVENPWIRSKGYEYLPFHEETAINIVLWRRGIDKQYNRIFQNTLWFSTFKLVEENDSIINMYIDGDENQMCEDSSKMLFYHGIKDVSELEKVIEYLKNKK